MSLKFPLQFDRSQWPQKRNSCGVCRGKLVDTVVYLSGGVSYDLEKSLLADSDTFLACGIHRADAERSVDGLDSGGSRTGAVRFELLLDAMLAILSDGDRR